MCYDYRVFRVDFGTKCRFVGCIWSVIVLKTMEGGRIEMNLGRQVDGERYPHRDEALVIMVISTNCLVTIIVVNVCSDLHKALQRCVKRSNKASSRIYYDSIIHIKL